MPDPFRNLLRLWLPDTPAFAVANADFSRIFLLVQEQMFSFEHPGLEFWRLWNEPARLKVVHHAKLWLKHINSLFCADSDVGWFDVMLAAYLGNPAGNWKSIADCAGTLLQQKIAEDDPEACCAALRGLYGILREPYASNALFRDIEVPLAGVLARMELRGMRIDCDNLRRYGDALQQRITAIESDIYALTGEAFNLNSPKQLGVVLFEKLAIDPGKKVRKNKNGYSTDAEVLHRIRDAHPVIPLLLEYRQLSKLLSTYVEGLLKAVHPDGKIHTTFHMTATATGRLSSSDPNLQNIPIRSELGGELRRMLIADPGEVLVDADYAQIELRLLAHMADDPAMIAAFQNHEDIHTATAAKVFHVAPEAVTPELRRRAKAVNFGIVYGISAFSLAEDLGITPDEARTYMTQYFALYGRVREYLDRTVHDARKNGYVETLFGRRRWIPELKSPAFPVRSFGERVALNAPIQGSAADLIKLAMVRTSAALKKAGLASELILQIHDELILGAPAAEAPEAARILRETMEHAMELKVPLEVSLAVGANYLELK